MLGAQSLSIDDTVNTVEDIFSITEEAFGFDLTKYVHFFEFEVNATYYMDKDVYGLMANLFQDSSDMKILNKIFEGDYAQTSIKLTPSTKSINSLDWFDFTIEPKVNSIGNAFVVRLLCRNPAFKNMVEKVKRTEKTVTSIINKVIAK